MTHEGDKIPMSVLQKDLTIDKEGCTINGGQPNGKEVKDVSVAKNGTNLNKDKIGKGNNNENTSLINCRGLSKSAKNSYLWAALVISWTSVLFSLGTGVAAIVLAVQGDSETLFAYGLDAILDSLSSVAVVWRFHGPETAQSQVKERRACIAIGVLFLVSATSLIIKSIHSIATERHEAKEIILFETFGLVCATFSILLATAKIYVGLKLDSTALATDSIITYVGAAACIAGVAGLELYVQNSHLWYMDSVFGIACGLFLFCFGVRILYLMFRKKPHERLHEERDQ